jgi:hypothetical protein
LRSRYSSTAGSQVMLNLEDTCLGVDAQIKVSSTWKELWKQKKGKLEDNKWRRS